MMTFVTVADGMAAPVIRYFVTKIGRGLTTIDMLAVYWVNLLQMPISKYLDRTKERMTIIRYNDRHIRYCSLYFICFC